jgi:chromate reductase
MSTNIHLVGISGSLRKASYNTALLKAAQELLPEDVTIEIAEIGSLPLYSSDIDGDFRPETVTKFRNTLATADAFVFVSPEYNYTIPGGLKNAIDWASRGQDSPIINKPVALMGATGGLWGTMRMQQAFRPVFQYLNMFPVNKPEVLVAQVHTKFNSELKLVDEPTKNIIREQLKALKKLTLQLKK